MWLPEKAGLRPPACIGQKETGHVKGEVELRGGRRVCLALVLGRSLRAEGKSRVGGAGLREAAGPTAHTKYRSPPLCVSKKKGLSSGQDFHQ